MSTRLRPLFAALCAASMVISSVLTAASASAATAPMTPVGLPSAIEAPAAYVAQSSCDPTVKPGTAKLGSLLAQTYPGTSYASAYACGTDGSTSEHYEGRAIDWMASIRDKIQFADATAVLHWLLATDSHGNKFANARRLGVMYLIYDNRMWGAWDTAWEPYNGCARMPARSDDNACHRNHMHISLSWNGALGKTSFWTKKVSSTDYGPCRAADLNWAAPWRAFNPSYCPQYASVKAAARSSATKIALVKYSGAVLYTNSRGPAVLAVQRALLVSQTATLDAATRAAVRTFQSHHHLVVSGGVGASTWRALLAAVR